MIYHFEMDFRARVDILRKYMEENRIGVSVILNPTNIFYFTNYSTVISSRLSVGLITPQEVSLIVPHVETENAIGFSLEKGYVDHVYTYYEKPVEAPLTAKVMELFAEHLSKNPKSLKVGIEYGFANLNLFHFIQGLGFDIVDIQPQIVLQRGRKSEKEVTLIRIAAELCNAAMDATLKNIRPGVTEIELEGCGNDAVNKLASTKYEGANLFYFGNILSGPVRTSMPHVASSSRKLQHGDILVCSRQIGINGWKAEIERTCFLGEASEEQKRIFQIVRSAQKNVIDMVKPGVLCSDVDLKTFEILKSNGLADYVTHRSGHGIGITVHESPILSFTDNTVIEKGMCFSAEPGVYIPNIGGFRHSDTVLVTETGCEIITEAPRDFEDLIF